MANLIVATGKTLDAGIEVIEGSASIITGIFCGLSSYDRVTVRATVSFACCGHGRPQSGRIRKRRCGHVSHGHGNDRREDQPFRDSYCQAFGQRTDEGDNKGGDEEEYHDDRIRPSRSGVKEQEQDERREEEMDERIPQCRQ